MRAAAAGWQGDGANAHHLYGKAVAASWAAGDRVTLVQALNNWADLELMNGHPVEAERLLRDALRAAHDPEDAQLLPAVLLNLGFARHANGDDIAAMVNFRAALDAAAGQPNTGFQLAVLVGTASVAAAHRRFQLAATLCAAACALVEMSDEKLQPYLIQMQDATHDVVQTALAEDACSRAWRLGLQLTALEAVALARQVDGLGPGALDSNKSPRVASRKSPLAAT